MKKDDQNASLEYFEEYRAKKRELEHMIVEEKKMRRALDEIERAFQIDGRGRCSSGHGT